MNREINIVLLGNKGVGKTSFTRVLKEGFCPPKYTPTKNGIVLSTMHIKTYGSQKSQEHLSELSLNFLDIGNISPSIIETIHADAGIVFFDLTDMKSYHSVQKWQNISRRFGHTVICGNKLDLSCERIWPYMIYDVDGKAYFDAPYFDISVSKDFGTENPVINILQKVICSKIKTFSRLV